MQVKHKYKVWEQHKHHQQTMPLPSYINIIWNSIKLIQQPIPIFSIYIIKYITKLTP